MPPFAPQRLSARPFAPRAGSPRRAWVRALAGGAAAVATCVGAQAQVVRVPAGSFPISAAVSAPAKGRVVWISGTTAPTTAGAPLGDTKAQTVATLKRIAELLQAQGLGLGDVTMMRVYLVGVPELGGRMDFAGMMAGYTQFFGVAGQPNTPARTTVQVAGLAGPGATVEIEVQAIKER